MNVCLSDSESKQIHQCVTLMQKVLGDDLLGIYLYGSAFLGGLQKYSDLDLLVVTNRDLQLSEKKYLVRKLLGISGIYMKSSKRPIEITILEKAKVNPWKYPPTCTFQYGEWLRKDFEKESEELLKPFKMPDIALLVIQVLLASSSVFGPKASTFLVDPPYKDILRALSHALNELKGTYYDDTRNTMLTYCRIWYTLEEGVIASKLQAANWVLNRLPKNLRSVIERAQAIARGDLEESWEDLHDQIPLCAQYIYDKSSCSFILLVQILLQGL